MSDKKTPAAIAAAKNIPSHVVLLDRSGEWASGTVLATTADVLASLEKSGAKYREATASERCIAGFSS
jgi:hypothetical protein